MPVIKVTLIEGYDGDTVQRLAERLTDAVRSTIAAPPEGITVIAEEVKPTSYMRGGQARVPGPPIPGAVDVARDFLARMEARDLAGARTHLAETFEMTFPSGRRMTDLADLVAWSRTRYARVAKTIEGWDEGFQGARAVVSCRGTLSGEWLDGTAFSGIRFYDRFELLGGKIVKQEVWNDMAEHRAR
ncbi:MAG: tautomerase family protein [Pseudomonadota bacterium]